MPIASDLVVAPPATVETPDLIEITQPNVVPTPVRSSIVDSRFTSLANLITYVEGSPWVVDYFDGVVGTDDELSQNQPNQHPVYQQYIRIKDLEIRVQDTLSEALNSETNEFTVTGSSLTYPHFKPNVGGTFLADLGDGREAVFGVTDVQRKTIFNESCFTIQYTLINVGNGTAARRADLEAKTVATRVFKKNFLQSGINPILIESAAIDYDTLKRREHVLIRNYLMEFFKDEHRTVTMPHPSNRIYDNYLVSFLSRVLTSDDHELVKQIRLLNVSGDEGIKVYNLWSMISEVDISMLPLLNAKMWAIPVNLFTRQPSLASIRYSNMTDTIYPYGLIPGSTLPASVGGTELYDPDAVPTVYPALSEFTVSDGSSENVIIRPPMIHDACLDNFYVLSEAFYTNADEGQSALELILRKVLNNQAIEPSWVIELCDKAQTWRPLDRFYYMPILLVLIKACLHRL